MKIPTYILIVAMMLLSGCSYEIELAAEVKDDCSVDIKFTDGEPQIRYIVVAEAVGDKFDYKKAVWEINGNYKTVDKFTYGQLPEGFDQVVAPEPLISGKEYFFAVKGSGGGFGAVKVKYKCLTSL